ncbi:bifunctional protein FolD 4, chloroplastic-like [Momordica charantia]|uniref:Bifunctional protein FolD 4, chloroplastic-like n=1 Tax=Momordica charantia TaxID=3673 RepID=A0A6J1C8N4_MOMCH|nr:bifunctional protein FolD 4, chloroplastic-like [Momordica charantia]
MKVMDGELVAKEMMEEICGEVSRMKDAIGVAPGLALIRVGNLGSFELYVANVKKACESVEYEAVLSSISLHKDVDAFNSIHYAPRVLRNIRGVQAFAPCMPKGCIKLLHKYSIDIKGKLLSLVAAAKLKQGALLICFSCSIQLQLTTYRRISLCGPNSYGYVHLNDYSSPQCSTTSISSSWNSGLSMF